ncbi:phosphatase PAP2 family protein [Sciscionella sediminilitoris]|uniref:phosphatase PAP2 family protein n=1 Tax=Sciscionella sediminilitoris TaxID=1445613 RepID=UPI0004DF0F70|nr:phosphatase PAP2 family protein [Sciscionella sp. SE31]
MRRTTSLSITVLGLLAVTGVLGAVFAGQHSPSALDAWFFTTLAGPAGADPGWRSVLLTFSMPTLVYGAALLLAGYHLYRRRFRIAVLAVCAPPLAVLCSSVLLKPVFDRHYAGNLCYPSGHTTLLVATLTVFVLAHRRFGYPAVPLALIGAFGLIAGRYHYLTDTIGGAALGCAVGLGLYALSLRLRPRPWTGRSAGKSRADTSSGTHRQASPR